MKNAHIGVLLLVKLQASLKVTLIHWRSSHFLNSTNDTKLSKTSHLKKKNSLHLSRQYCKLIRNYCWQLFYRTTLAESFFTELFAITTLRICQLLLKPIILSNQTYTFKRQPYRMVQHTQTIHRLLPKNFLSVFDHFVELALKELIEFMLCMHLCDKKIFLLK